MTSRNDIENIIKLLLSKYDAEYALLFGSYARGEETDESDIDIIVYGGDKFKKTNIFAFAEEVRALTGKEVDVFEISEVDKETPFYNSVLREGVRIA